MKQLDARIASVNIFVSCVLSSSTAPIPYVSITMILIGSPSDDCPLRGVPQTQRPFVQALIVDPTPNPLDLFNSIRLSKYDFPVR
jgi:hypothetical protein